MAYLHRIWRTILLAIAVGCVFSGTGRSAEVKTPWIVTYHDGSANAYRFWQETAAGEVFFDYSPVQPANSSSGMYSGGQPQKGRLDRKQTDELWRWVRRFRSSNSLHAASRAKGTGAFTVKEPSGNSEFIVKNGPLLQAFNGFAAQIKGDAKWEETFPVVPGAERRQGGATSLQPGKNYTITTYWVEMPLADVQSFYEKKLKISKKSKQPDGSLKMSSNKGTIFLSRVGNQTQIKIIQGPM